MQTLDTLLTRLESEQLLRQLSEPELAYIFKHALTQESAYQSLLVKQRREIHRRVAEAIEELYAGGLDEYAGLLARHYAEAEDDVKTLEYATRAGAAAARRYANAEAISYYSTAIGVAERLGKRDASLYRERGKAYELEGDFERARADYDAALRAAREAHDGSAEWQSLIDLGFLWAGRNYARTGEFFQRAYELAQTRDDPRLRAHSLNRLGNWLVNTGEPEQGLQMHRQALEIFQQVHEEQGIAETLDLLGMANVMYGDILSAHDHFERAVELFRRLDDKPGLVSSLTSASFVSYPGTADTVPTPLNQVPHGERHSEQAIRLAQQMGSLSGESYAHFAAGQSFTSGDFGKCLAQAQEALRIATEIDHQQWIVGSHFTLAEIYYSMLAIDEALEHLETALPLAREVGSAWWIGNCSAYLALCYILKGDLQRARATLEPVMPRDHVPHAMQERRMLWAWGELALAEGDPKVALEIADRLIESVPGEKIEQPIPALLKLRGEALLALKRMDEARQALEEAKRGAQAREEPALLWSIQALLGRVYQRLKREDEARREFAAARQVIESLAGTVPDARLRKNLTRLALKQLPAAKSATARAPVKKKTGAATTRTRQVRGSRTSSRRKKK